MSDEDDKKPKKDENDPYNFFRLTVDDDNDGDKKPKGRKPFPFLAVLAIVVGAVLLMNMFFSSKPNDLVDFSKFRGLIESGRITRVVLGDPYFIGYGPETQSAASMQEKSWSPFSFSSSDDDSGRQVYRTNGLWSDDFEKLLIEKGVEYKFESRQSGIFIQILLNLLPFILLFAIYFIAMRRLGAGMNSMGIFGGSGKSKAVDEGKVKTRFSDVAGVDEAKEELVEVVDFLKSPKKYTDIGGKIPKGVLLVGPPGTGKTLLARAVAGEAGVPFFRISGSDFVEMFVGVGASRVRDLFRTAREKAPCIIFIDELDAIGKSRMNSLGGNDEREQTLNQLLVEMDGFDNEKGLIILAATNRPDILDPALLRPGRFDRQVSVDKPDVKGREAILRIHSKNVKLDSSVDFDSLAHATAGFSGADLANIVNEAALLAVRGGRKQVTMPDFDEAIEKTVVGLEKKTRVMSEEERKSVAVHETGHALVTVFTKNTSPVHKISIIPRGVGALGYTMQRSEEEKFLNTEKDLINDIDILLGGRAAEQICLGIVDTGAANDIQRATGIIRSMITQYGMSKKFYNVTLGKSGRGYASGEPELVREYSEETQKYIDEEIARMMAERYKHVIALLSKHKDLLLYISDQLLEKETMTGKEFEELVKAEDHCIQLMKQKKPKASSASASAAAEDKSSAKKKAGRPRKAKPSEA
ncbi:MAG: ATP-dependent zinc metalloprotease FtsH [Treponema sp.]|nr:ATP-dependent zinc metalloprotease FtsH [Treponema sp.]